MDNFTKDYEQYKNSGYEKTIGDLLKEEREFGMRKHFLAVMYVVDSLTQLLSQGAFSVDMSVIHLKVVSDRGDESIGIRVKDHSGEVMNIYEINNKFRPLFVKLLNAVGKIDNTISLVNKSLSEGQDFPLTPNGLNDIKNALLRPELQIIMENICLNNEIAKVPEASNTPALEKQKIKI